MIAALDLLLAALALVALGLAAFYAVVVVTGAFATRRLTACQETGRIAVIVPAHDEEAGIAGAIADIAPQLRPDDRLIVVADNCADRTAAVAASAGASVVERHDATKRGKGYALQFGVEALRADPPDIVCIIDADCRVERGAIAALAAVAARGRPAQAMYFMERPAGAGPRYAVAAFAWLLMNKVRQAGLAALFDVTRLTGSGMAFPWPLLAARNLASGEIVEDLALALELTQAGAAPVLVPDVVVRSEFPTSETAAARQRARWEHGSMRLAARRAPALLARALSKWDIRLAALALDVMIPPLTIFTTALTALFLLSLAAAAIGAGSAAPISASALALVGLSTLIAWARHGREVLSLSDIGAVAGFVLGKADVYGKEARASTRTWTRTDRGEGKEPS